MPSPRARIRASHVTNRKVELMEFDVFSSRLSPTPPLVPGVRSTRRNYLPGMYLETPQTILFRICTAPSLPPSLPRSVDIGGLLGLSLPFYFRLHCALSLYIVHVAVYI